MKTIFKIYGNGDLDIVDSELIQTGINGDYSFKENAITVPSIFEYPPHNLINHFVEKHSEKGWSLGGVVSDSGGNNDRTSNYINVTEWETCSIRLYYSDVTVRNPEFVILFYNQQNFTGRIIYSNNMTKETSGDSVIFKHQFNVQNENYIRISMDHYDNPKIEIKLMVCEGVQDIKRHYQAIEDMPVWVKDTGNPVSFFKEGIVTKGQLIAK